MNMKKVAVVTALTLETYQTLGYEEGKILDIMDSYERYGIKWFRLMGIDDLPRIYKEKFFDIKTITAEDMKSKRLQSTLIELAQRFWESEPSARETLETLVKGVPACPEDHIEAVAQTLCEFIQNECDDELHELVKWLQPFEVEAH